MLSTPAPAPTSTNSATGLIDTSSSGGGLNDLFSIQGALPGAGYVPPQTVSN